MPVVIVSAYFGPLLLIALLLWSGFALTWWLLYRPRRVAYELAVRSARGRIARDAADRSRVVKEYEQLKRVLRSHELDRRLAWERQVEELRIARLELPKRNGIIRAEWQRESDRVAQLRREITARNERRLLEWREHVRVTEAKRRTEWEQRVRETEVEQQRVRELNERNLERWRVDVQEHRRIRAEVEAHNTAIADATRRRDAERAKRAEHVRTLETQLEQARRAFEREAKSVQDEFASAVSRLERIRRDYLSLRKAFNDDRSALTDQQREHQFDEFLKGILLDEERISGIGTTRKATLAAYGIETAFDVRAEALEIPGFGPSLRGELLAWRSAMERRFRFDAKQQVTTTDLRALHMRYQPRRRGLQRTLSAGAEELASIRARADSRLTKARSNTLGILPALWQAEADLRAVKG